jgi:hypothetical protein
MIVNWLCNSNARARAATTKAADGRWHDCAGGGHYLLFPDVSIAIYCGGGDGASPIVWQNDDRLLTHALQQRIADAIARRPVRPVALFKEEAPGAEARASVPADDLPPPRPAPPDISGPKVRAVEPEVLRKLGIRPKSKVARTMEVLAQWLAAGPVRTVEIKERAEQAGVSWATVRRAADVLPVCIVRDGWGGAGSWWWSRGHWR